MPNGEAGGFPFTYFVYAAACSEVELDVLTGEVGSRLSLSPSLSLPPLSGLFLPLSPLSLSAPLLLFFCLHARDCSLLFSCVQLQLLRTDIVYDGGYSLNYALDTGQVEGAFMQGIGMFFQEVSAGRVSPRGGRCAACR